MDRAEGIRIDARLHIPADEIHERTSRASGPGGQHVNKTETRVTLRWNVWESPSLDPGQRRRLIDGLGPRLTRRGHLVVHAQRFRSRSRNRAVARERMAEVVREALETRRTRVPTAPTRGATKRRLDAKRHRSAVKRTRRRPGDDP